MTGSTEARGSALSLALQDLLQGVLVHIQPLKLDCAKVKSKYQSEMARLSPVRVKKWSTVSRMEGSIPHNFRVGGCS